MLTRHNGKVDFYSRRDDDTTDIIGHLIGVGVKRRGADDENDGRHADTRDMLVNML